MSTDDERRVTRRTRRRFLAGTAVASAAGLAGCTGILDGSTDGGDGSAEQLETADFRGSGPLVESRPDPGGVSMDDLPDLSGELNVYIGGGEGGLYEDLLDLLSKKYPDFDVFLKSDASSSLANTIVEERKAGNTQADVFWSVDAGSLAYVANQGAAAQLPQEARDPVDDSFVGQEGRWVGVAGRARAIPYNTDRFSESDVPTKVAEFPQTSALGDAVGWAPTYGAFQAFVTAMRILEGRDATKQWLTDMLDHGVSDFGNEFFVSNAVADGELGAGFANHYYALRVKSQRPDAPVDLAFTENDAGALVNVSGAAAIEGSQRADLAANFVRHLVSAEAQEFFATRTFAYPTTPDVEPVGDLPSVDELKPPEIDLSKLSNIQPTLDLMREAGVL